MRFQINPFSDKLDISGMGPGVTSVDFVTGNSGGLVAADSGYNINILGDNTSGINTVGNGSPNTLTIFGLASTTAQIGTTRYATNLEAGAQASTTTALTPSNIPSLFSVTPLPASQGGTGLSSPAAHSLVVTNGSSAFTALGTAANGQIPIGSIGSNPVLASITSSGGTITITNGPGSINIEANGTAILETLTGNTGGALSPTAGNINTLGTGSITIAGAGSTLTTQLTGLTSHNVLVGAGTSTITNLAPSATSGIPLISQGVAADPVFGTAVVAGGGTGAISFNTKGVVVSGATATTALASLTLTDGQIVIGSTAGSPAAATLTAGSNITITNAGNSITIASTAVGLAWSDQSGIFTAVSSNGYFITAASTPTLPAAPTEGSEVAFIVDTASACTITANTGQVIRIGSAVSAAAGTAASNARGDTINLVFRTVGLAWIAKSSIGTWTVT